MRRPGLSPLGPSGLGWLPCATRGRETGVSTSTGTSEHRDRARSPVSKQRGHSTFPARLRRGGQSGHGEGPELQCDDIVTVRLTGVPWQRCQFHLIHNAMAHVPKLAMRSQVAADLKAVFDAPDRPEAQRQLEIVAKRYAVKAPKLAEWLEHDVPEGLTVFTLPRRHRRRLRTSNMLERLKRGDQAADAGCRPVPERGVGAAAGQRRLDGDQRGVGDEPQVPDDGTGLTRPRSSRGFTETSLHLPHAAMAVLTATTESASCPA